MTQGGKLTNGVADDESAQRIPDKRDPVNHEAIIRRGASPRAISHWFCRIVTRPAVGFDRATYGKKLKYLRSQSVAANVDAVVRTAPGIRRRVKNEPAIVFQVRRQVRQIGRDRVVRHKDVFEGLGSPALDLTGAI
eukprot:CAMPEP_0175045494 /NCGR_PEP_ID=MMETSP0052_2-20121109/4458_1 /TAXON_ID=51329 ORGANISM="Polytomella parva, Strain SAG 63-3" /NCGR_SAMPLE_ID=MMETSP0052_2 /ASSEMBLY_ACC=CAM_ASM_000194 /LENGTH=135 /DNA_ID=CAMNT_0016309039 /DNA_START=206 /DNA_END=613 /DNA_ORIENTATION=-